MRKWGEVTPTWYVNVMSIQEKNIRHKVEPQGEETGGFTNFKHMYISSNQYVLSR